MELVTEGRKLVTVRSIAAINPIEKADAIEVATVDGWDVVVKKNEFKVGDQVLFFEIDCLLPMKDERFSFLAKGKEQELFRLRTIKLRGQVSQGLVLPISQFPELPIIQDVGLENLLGITKYEIPDSGSGVRSCKPASTFPHFIPKTDEERIQNIYNKYKELYEDVEFSVSEKLDGSSVTIASIKDKSLFIEKLCTEEYPFSFTNGQTIVASRNQTLQYDETSHFWKGVQNSNLIAISQQILDETDRQLALQGELIGPGLQGNREGLTDYEVRVFKIWDIEKKEYLDLEQFNTICLLFNIKTVPQLGVANPFKKTLQELLNDSKGKNSAGFNIEGKVYSSTKKIDGKTLHFKVINNDFLLEKGK